MKRHDESTSLSHEKDPQIRQSIRRASLLLTAGVLLSRVIGFVREWALAHFVGATGLTDVYLASFTVPDFMNYLMAAGALSTSFIPVLSSRLRESEKSGETLFRYVSTMMGVFFIVLLAIAEIFAPTLAEWVAPGFSAEQKSLLTDLIRIILPAQFFFLWGGLANAVQQTHGNFLYTALGGIFYNCGIITLGILLHARYGVMAFSFGVLAGAFFSHGILQWWGLRKLNYSAFPLFKGNAETRADFKRYLWLSLPVMLGFSLAVTDEWIAKYFASDLEAKTLSYLGYARTLMRVPVAILGQVAGMASFPYLSKLWAGKSYDDYASLLSRELMKVWAFAPLAGILLYVHAEPITHFVYFGGRFTDNDLEATAELLRWLGIGVPFWIAQVILGRGFYAAQRTWLPSILGSLMSLLAIPIYQWASVKWQGIGLAIASSLSIAIYCAVLGVFLCFHLKKHSPKFSFQNFYAFVALWSLVLAVEFEVALWIRGTGLYSHTRASAFLDIIVVTAVVGGIALLLLRTLFKPVTGNEALL